jgi:hypothetical protein
VETAVGPLQGQEGIANLSRAFLFAGGKSVLSTLWQADDASAALLMRRFYAHPANNRRPDEALTAAKRDVLRKYGVRAVPYHWAGFIIEAVARSLGFKIQGSILMSLNPKIRNRILSNVKKRVLENHFNAAGVDYDAWLKRVDQQRTDLLVIDEAGFEDAIRSLLLELRSSHATFYHEIPTRFPPQHTINATLRSVEQNGSSAWMFLDVFPDGPAYAAGIRSGDLLHRLDGVEQTPPASVCNRKSTQTHCLPRCKWQSRD